MAPTVRYIRESYFVINDNTDSVRKGFCRSKDDHVIINAAYTHPDRRIYRTVLKTIGR